MIPSAPDPLTYTDDYQQHILRYHIRLRKQADPKRTKLYTEFRQDGKKLENWTEARREGCTRYLNRYECTRYFLHMRNDSHFQVNLGSLEWWEPTCITCIAMEIDTDDAKDVGRQRLVSIKNSCVIKGYEPWDLGPITIIDEKDNLTEQLIASGVTVGVGIIILAIMYVYKEKIKGFLGVEDEDEDNNEGNEETTKKNKLRSFFSRGNKKKKVHEEGDENDDGVIETEEIDESGRGVEITNSKQSAVSGRSEGSSAGSDESDKSQDSGGSA